MTSLVLTPATPGTAGVSGTLACGGDDYDLLAGFKFPTTVTEQTYAESPHTEGRVRTRWRPLNPTGSGQVTVRGTSMQDMEAKAHSFQSLIATTNRYGGTLTYSPTGGTAISYDVVSIQLSEETNLDRRYARSPWEAEFGFEFECKPYGMLTSRSVSFTGGTLTGPIDYIEIPDIPGQADALATLTLSDPSSQSRDHIEFGLEQDGYNPASPPDLNLAGTADLNNTGLAGTAYTASGSYASRTWRASVTTTPVAVASTGAQSHQGRRKIRARLKAFGTGPAYARLAYRIGDGSWEHNPWHTLLDDMWSEPDLGNLYVPMGETWEGRIEAFSDTAGDTVAVDSLYILPAQIYGNARKPEVSSDALTFVARDEFSQAAGALTGKTLPLGGVWAGTGDATDFNVTDTYHRAERTAISDTPGNFSNGRLMLAGTVAYTEAVVQIRSAWSWSASGFDVTSGLVLRYVDQNNWLMGVATPDAYLVGIYKCVGGVQSPLATTSTGVFSPNYYWTLRAKVTAAGQAFFWYGGAAGVPSSPQVSVYDAALATGGALEDGRVGFVDYYASSQANTRLYENFSAYASTDTTHALWTGQSIRFKSDRVERENAAGTRWGRAPVFEGQHLRIPPAGREDRRSRIAVLARRNDINGGLPSDIGGTADSLTAILTVIPRVLLTGD